MTFLVFVGVFIGLACLGVPLVTLALFAALTAEPDPWPESHAAPDAPAGRASSAAPRDSGPPCLREAEQNVAPGRPAERERRGAAGRIDFSGTTV